jgi:predicted DNA-binding transcriptional regulator AlpA
MHKTVKRVETAPASTQAKLLTAEQMMELLCVSRTGLYLLMRQEGLPYIKFGVTRGAALRFNVRSVEQWLAQNERHAVEHGGAQVLSTPAGLHQR